VVVRVTH